MGDPLSNQFSKKAKAEYEAGNYLPAARGFEEAAQAARNEGDKLAAAEQDNNRSVALLKAGDAQGALDAAFETDQVFAASGDLSRQGMALGNQAAALDALNRLDEAAAAYQRSADIFRQTGDNELRSFVLKSLSALQVRSGRQLEALATMQAALDQQKKLTLRERLLKKLLQIPFRMFK